MLITSTKEVKIMAGRKIPTALKALKGTARADRLNPDEPIPDLNIPPVPSHLNEIAKKEYERTSKELLKMGVLSNIDRSALSAYCDYYSRWVQASIEMGDEPLTITTFHGNVIQNPLLGIQNTAKDQMRKFLIEFGMTPASRSKVSVKKKDPGKKKSPFAKVA